MDKKKPGVQLPKDALQRVNLGHSFAEYDPALRQAGVFVKTPAVIAATDENRSKCFFVGRRGTGKTATALHLTASDRTAVQVHPQLFVPTTAKVDAEQLADTRQKPFKSLVTSFTRAILLEAVREWWRQKRLALDDLPATLKRDRQLIEEFDFDQRQLRLQTDIFDALATNNEKEWLRLVTRAKDSIGAVDELATDHATAASIVIDRVDDSWDGSDKAVMFLMGLMHACVQLSATCNSVSIMLFLRENMFERVRQD